jgi:hypothetical protein
MRHSLFLRQTTIRAIARGWDVGSVGSYCLQRVLAIDVYITGLAEAKGWPDPILEVQWVAATVGCVTEDKGALAPGTAELEVAAVPMPMVAVQSGDAGARWEACVAAALGLTLLVMLWLVSVMRAA